MSKSIRYRARIAGQSGDRMRTKRYEFVATLGGAATALPLAALPAIDTAVF